jgi:cell wall-associated NlpC family hydrolase
MDSLVKVCAGGVATAGALILGLAILAGGISSSAATQGAAAASLLGQLQQEECVPIGPVPTLTAAQATNAETIVAAAETLGAGERGAQIALMTAYTESSLENLGPESGNDGSLGLFQQRVAAGWGTTAEELDPTDATGMFIQHLMADPDWQSILPWVAAQAVQRSAFSDGANYRVNWGLAGTLLTAITGLADNQNCGGMNGAQPAGPASQFGLPKGFVIPSGATRAETLAITYAISKLGDAYVWAATGPKSFDCSGLTMMAWAQADVPLDHYTGDQLNEGTPVADYAAISPGDLVLIPGSDGTLAAPGHVGIFIGYGLVLSAVDPQQGVIVQTWANFTAGGLSGIRHLG